MILHPFESEFSPDDLPTVSGQPLTKPELESHARGRGHWVRAQRAQQNAVIDAVYGFYLAKHFDVAISTFSGWTNKRAEIAVDAVRTRLWKCAVIDLAGVNDENSPLRMASLQAVLTSMLEVLSASSHASAADTYEDVQQLRAQTNANTVIPLKYVRHLRNKWAGHPSMDRDFDSWAGADESLSVPLLEEALAILVRAHQAAADLIRRSVVLEPLFQDPGPGARTGDSDEGPVESVPVGVAWANVTSIAQVMKEAATKAAYALVDQLVSPPGYGQEHDTDIGSSSEHARLRESIDAAVRAHLDAEAAE